MNKIKLIKSFAGYPVWEYQLKDNYYYPCLNTRWHKTIHKDIVEWMKDHFEEVRERPNTWGELWYIGWWYISWNAEVTAVKTCKAEKSSSDIFNTKEQSEASIALAKITQLLDRYDIPEESDVWFDRVSCTATSQNTKRNKLLEFDTVEKRDHFYNHHKALIDKLAPFYIF